MQNLVEKIQQEILDNGYKSALALFWSIIDQAQPIFDRLPDGTERLAALQAALYQPLRGWTVRQKIEDLAKVYETESFGFSPLELGADQGHLDYLLWHANYVLDSDSEVLPITQGQVKALMRLSYEYGSTKQCYEGP
jgi:hypothetical protein